MTHLPRVLSREQVQESLELLSSRFGVPVPKLDWTRTRRGKYLPNRKHPVSNGRSGTIRLGPRCWRNNEATMLHEFAHHVDWCRGGIVRDLTDAEKYHLAMWRGGLSNRRPVRIRPVYHGFSFTVILMDVIFEWGIDYDWRQEYAMVQKMHARILKIFDDYLTRPLFSITVCAVGASGPAKGKTK